MKIHTSASEEQVREAVRVVPGVRRLSRMLGEDA